MKNVEILEDRKKQKQNKSDPVAYSQEYQNMLGSLIHLDDKDKKKLVKKLTNEINDWKNDSAELHKTLEDWSDIIDGVVEQTEWPYEGAPNIHIDLIGICMKIYHTIATRSILGQQEIWYGITTTDSDLADQWIDKVEEMVNVKTETEWNLKEMMRDAFYCGARDGLAVLKIPYAEDYEKLKEVIYIESVDQLLDEFDGDLSSSGLDKETIAELMQRVTSEASPENPVELVIEYDKPVYIGPKAYLVERINFVTFPANARSISKEDCRGHGDRYFLRKGEVKRRGADKIWFKESVDFILNKKKYDEDSNFNKNRDENIGLGDEGSKDRLEFFDLVYYCDIDDDGREEKYLLTFSVENKTLMGIMDYPYRTDYYALFRREKRPGQLDGRSIVGELEYLNDEVDHRHNSRSLSMDITNIPSFKAKRSAQDDFDPSAEENKWRPGVTFWLKDPESFEQFKVQPVDYGQSLAEENNLMKLASLIVGFDIYTFSGKAMPEDPNAPGNKTAMLLEQGNLRMQNVLEELRYGVDKVSEIVLSHLYQFAASQVAYKTIDQNGRFVTKEFPKKVLRSGVLLRMRAANVITNADDELKKWIFVRQLMLSEPVIANDAKKRVALLRKTASRANLYGLDKIIPTDQDLQMFELQQAMAMKAQQQQQGGGLQQPQGPSKLDQAVERAKAAGAADDLKTNKIKNASERMKALTAMKDSLGGTNA